MTGGTGYAGRARYYAAEVSQVPVPALLAGLLRPGLAVAEIPSGTGHFLPAYSAAGADITLADACPQMLATALAQAARSDIAVTVISSLIEDLQGRVGPFDLIVMPNGALNQLAADVPPATLLSAIATLLAPGGLLLAQVLAPATACAFYDPCLPDGDWYQDRQFAGGDGQTVIRRRRQHHRDNLVRIDFKLAAGGSQLHRQQVTLRPIRVEEAGTTFAGAGLLVLQAGAGAGGLAEILARRQPRTLQ